MRAEDLLNPQRDVFAAAHAADAELDRWLAALKAAQAQLGRIGQDELVSDEQVRKIAAGLTESDAARVSKAAAGVHLGHKDPEEFTETVSATTNADDLGRSVEAAVAFGQAVEGIAKTIYVRRRGLALAPLLPRAATSPPALSQDAPPAPPVPFRDVVDASQAVLADAVDSAHAEALEKVRQARDQADHALRRLEEGASAALNERRRRKALLASEKHATAANSFAGPGFVAALAALFASWVATALTGNGWFFVIPLLVWFFAARIIKARRTASVQRRLDTESAMVAELEAWLAETRASSQS